MPQKIRFTRTKLNLKTSPIKHQTSDSPGQISLRKPETNTNQASGHTQAMGYTQITTGNVRLDHFRKKRGKHKSWNDIHG